MSGPSPLGQKLFMTCIVISTGSGLIGMPPIGRSLLGVLSFRPETFSRIVQTGERRAIMGGNGHEKTHENNGMDRLEIGFEEAVLQRYGKAAQEAEVGLCVPVNYDRSLLQVIPAEILEKDYG